MGVQSDYDNRDCWQVSGKAILKFEDEGYVTGVTEGPVDSSSSCQDTFGSTSAPWMWDPLNCSKQLDEWFANEYNKGQFARSNHHDHDRWLPQFAVPMDVQSSHEDCYWDGECDAIDCTSSKDGSAWKFLVINSAANLWKYFDIASKSIKEASAEFSVDKETSFDLYWGNAKESVEPLNQMLNGIAIALGTLITAASLGSGAWALAGPAVSGLISVGILHDKSKDLNVGNKMKVEAIAKGWLDGWKDILQPVVNDLTNGPGKSGDMDVRDIFSGGDWVLSNNAPILGIKLGDSVGIGQAVYHLILGAIINISWKSQNVYLACHDMTKEEYEAQEKKGFRSGTNDTRLRHWYDGTGCFYQAVKPKKYIDGTYGYQIHPPGWGEMYEPGRTDNNPLGLPFDTHDIIESSLNGYRKGGFNYTLSTKDVADAVFSLGNSSTSTVRDVVKTPGFFQIPICWPKALVEQTHEDAIDVFFGNLAQVKSHTQNGYLKFCWYNKDNWGVSMDDVMDSNWQY
ncbi:hypothetical protein Forpi1262_v017667 [Fusarium oxysporum f. sp. raphani]|uniref:Uncharacterized protein n=1 Tax=Fusarium oxysporum f. sp. raphani TaxID=96318 RepID=A0A8J5NRF6_FUSOX|nr:hypothetical protein Forpi1262_v017667 [Fusarium oxysporum f. sp. raphani]